MKLPGPLRALFFCFSVLVSSTSAAIGQSGTEPPPGAVIGTNPSDALAQSAAWIEQKSGSAPRLLTAQSTDGGAGWTGAQALAVPHDCDTCRIEAVSLDLVGRTHILLTASGTNPDDGGLYIYSTEGDGRTFRSTRRLFANHMNGIASEPVLAINSDASDHAFRNHIYVAWVVRSRGNTPYSEILVSLSVNSGWTFSYPPVRVNQGNNDDVSQPQIDLGQNGSLSVSWLQATGLKKSYNSNEAAILYLAGVLRGSRQSK